MDLERFITDKLAEREARARSPEFLAEMARENAEFSTILKQLGDNTFEAGVTTLLKMPTALFLKSLKTAYSKKYSFSNYANDSVRILFSKDGAAHSTLKVAAGALHLAGKSAKIGVRQLLKL